MVDPTATPRSPPLPLAGVLVLESWGAPAEDTVVRFPAGADRVILLRRGAPDNNMFARLVFPAGSVTAARGDTITLRIRPRAGVFGIDLETEDQLHPGGQIAFSYGLHFVAPAGAGAAYGNDYRFERYLAVSRLAPDSTVVFLDSYRIASDVLTAPISGVGSYLVAAPRSAPRFRNIAW